MHDFVESGVPRSERRIVFREIYQKYDFRT